MGRRTVLGVVTVVAILSALLGWAAGQRISSPAQIAAETAPPEASLITVPVESIQLSVDVISRGTLEFSDTESLEVQPTTIDGTTIITRTVVEVGDELNEGDVMIEVAGRPVFVLEGELPEYRDLLPESDGPDVLQLEEALSRLGLDPGEIDGKYTTGTERALEALYLRAGYTANLPDAQELSEIELARDSLDEARDSLAELQRQGQGDDGGSVSGIVRAEENLKTAKRALDRAHADQASANSAATAEVEAANEVERSTKAELDAAKKRLNAARDGEHPDTGQPASRAELDELLAVRDAARAAYDEAVQVRDDAVSASLRVASDQAEFVRLAKAEVRIAEAELSDARSQAMAFDGGDSDDNAIQRARDRVADAQKDLAEVEARVGTTFPTAEFRFLPTLPRTVQRVFAERGDVPSGSVMEVSGSGVSITGSISKVDRPLLNVGDTGIFDLPDLGIEVPLEISFLADDPGGGSLGDDRFLMRMKPTGDNVPEEAYGQNARVTIPVGSTVGEVLAVPLAALSAGADGSSRLEVETSPGETTFVRVSTGLKALGLIEVTPLDGDEINQGDRVVVGRDNPTGARAGDEPDDAGDDEEDGG